MSTPIGTTVGARERERGFGPVELGIGYFAAYYLVLAAWMGVSPHSFYEVIGPFGVLNDHYVRDNATSFAALGVGLGCSLRRPAWRVPALAVATVQFALHSLNHLLDIANAHPAWVGYFDFFSLAASAVLLAWLWRGAMNAALASTTPLEGSAT